MPEAQRLFGYDYDDDDNDGANGRRGAGQSALGSD
jgi:hypothetical protein